MSDVNRLKDLINLKREEFEFLNRLKDSCAKYAVESGFRDQMFEGLTAEQREGRVGQLLAAAVFTANQHGEASEFWEAFRDGTLHSPCAKSEKMEALGIPVLTAKEEEIGDELIRLCDKADFHGVDLARAVYSKMLYNWTRARLHGGKKA
jgi:NTP pyrophosphatase (non-canonical NTP hydrolase)